MFCCVPHIPHICHTVPVFFFSLLAPPSLSFRVCLYYTSSPFPYVFSIFSFPLVPYHSLRLTFFSLFSPSTNITVCPHPEPVQGRFESASPEFSSRGRRQSDSGDIRPDKHASGGLSRWWLGLRSGLPEHSAAGKSR